MFTVGKVTSVICQTACRDVFTVTEMQQVSVRMAHLKSCLLCSANFPLNWICSG